MYLLDVILQFAAKFNLEVDVIKLVTKSEIGVLVIKQCAIRREKRVYTQIVHGQCINIMTMMGQNIIKILNLVFLATTRLICTDTKWT